MLLALLGRTGLSGPEGRTVTGQTDAAPADATTKLQQALSTLLDALKSDTPASPSTTQDQTSAAVTPTVGDAIRTILGMLTPVATPTVIPTTAATVNTDATGDAVAAAAPKPNLDALNRVLTHYTAQSAAASSVVMLVR